MLQKDTRTPFRMFDVPYFNRTLLTGHGVQTRAQYNNELTANLETAIAFFSTVLLHALELFRFCLRPPAPLFFPHWFRATCFPMFFRCLNTAEHFPHVSDDSSMKSLDRIGGCFYFFCDTYFSSYNAQLRPCDVATTFNADSNRGEHTSEQSTMCFDKFVSIGLPAVRRRPNPIISVHSLPKFCLMPMEDAFDVYFTSQNPKLNFFQDCVPFHFFCRTMATCSRPRSQPLSLSTAQISTLQAPHATPLPLGARSSSHRLCFRRSCSSSGVTVVSRELAPGCLLHRWYTHRLTHRRVDHLGLRWRHS